jgi:hypothetical protein
MLCFRVEAPLSTFCHQPCLLLEASTTSEEFLKSVVPAIHLEARGCYLVAFFVIGQLDLIGVWVGECQKTNVIKAYVSKKLDYIFKF